MMIVKHSTLPINGLISAEFLSLLGNQVAVITIPLLVLQYTNSSMVAGIAVAANTIPVVIAMFVGGKAIDRFGAWPVSIMADILSCLSVLTLPLAFIIFSGNVSTPLIFILIFAGALFDPTGVIARHTLVPGLTRFAGKRLDQVNTLRGGFENAADFIGPAIGASLIVLMGINNTFFANAVSFLLCAIIFIATVPRKKSTSQKTPDNDVLSGVRFLFGDVKLKVLAYTGIISGFVIGAFLGLLLSVLATQHFHNTALSGICASAFGITATISAFSFSRLNNLFSHSFIYYGGLLIMGLGILLSGIVISQYGLVVTLAFTGLAGAGNPLEQTILQEQTPGKFAGQVFAALPAIRFAASSLGVILTGLLAEFYTVNIVLMLSGGLLVVTAIAGWFIAPLKEKGRNPKKVIL